MAKYSPKCFFKNLEKILDSCNVTKLEFAEGIGVKPQTVYAWYSRNKLPDWVVILYKTIRFLNKKGKNPESSILDLFDSDLNLQTESMKKVDELKKTLHSLEKRKRSLERQLTTIQKHIDYQYKIYRRARHCNFITFHEKYVCNTIEGLRQLEEWRDTNSFPKYINNTKIYYEIGKEKYKNELYKYALIGDIDWGGINDLSPTKDYNKSNKEYFLFEERLMKELAEKQKNNDN